MPMKMRSYHIIIHVVVLYLDVISHGADAGIENKNSFF
jgi:hypothetical protein